MNLTTQTLTRNRQRSASLRLVSVAVGALSLFACATVPLPPTGALQAAETAITTAEQARVADYAAPELNESRKTLAAARAAVLKEEMVTAERLAEQSRLNTELATAKAEMLKAKNVNENMQKSITILKQEMQRNTGARP